MDQIDRQIRLDQIRQIGRQIDKFDWFDGLGRQIDTWMDGQIHGQIVRMIDRWIDRQIDKLIDRQICRWVDRQIDMQVGRQIDRQI